MMIPKIMFKKAIVTVLVSMIPLLVVVLILEVILRTTHLFGAKISWSTPDPILTYRFAPGSRYWHHQENDHPITGKINSYGWRDQEWSLQKAPNIFRIAVLGDSYVEAFQVESESTFLKIAENQFNKDSTIKLELMNFGRSGFTQTEELVVLKHDVARFAPDMVILFFLPINDIADVRRETAPHVQRPFYHRSHNGELVLDTRFRETSTFKIKSFVDPFKRKSALLSLIAERAVAFQFGGFCRHDQMNPETPKNLGGFLSLCTDNSDPEFAQSYNMNKILIRNMVEYSQKNNIKFMLVCLDIPTYIPELEQQYLMIDSTFNTNFFEDDLKEYANMLDIEYLGLQRLFRQHYTKTGRQLHWIHWNYEGHEVVANALVNKLRPFIHQKRGRHPSPPLQSQ